MKKEIWIMCGVEYGFGSETYNFEEKVLKVSLETGKILKDSFLRLIIVKLPFGKCMLGIINIYSFGHGYSELDNFRENTKIGKVFFSEKELEVVNKQHNT